MKNKIEYTESRFSFEVGDDLYDVYFRDKTDTIVRIYRDSGGGLVLTECSQKHPHNKTKALYFLKTYIDGLPTA